jgi:hypothetical protein
MNDLILKEDVVALISSAGETNVVDFDYTTAKKASYLTIDDSSIVCRLFKDFKEADCYDESYYYVSDVFASRNQLFGSFTEYFEYYKSTFETECCTQAVCFLLSTSLQGFRVDKFLEKEEVKFLGVTNKFVDELVKSILDKDFLIRYQEQVGQTKVAWQILMNLIDLITYMNQSAKCDVRTDYLFSLMFDVKEFRTYLVNTEEYKKLN